MTWSYFKIFYLHIPLWKMRYQAHKQIISPDRRYSLHSGEENPGRFPEEPVRNIRLVAAGDESSGLNEQRAPCRGSCSGSNEPERLKGLRSSQAPSSADRTREPFLFPEFLSERQSLPAGR